MRAHYLSSVVDASGDLLPGAVISVCVNGTNGGTLLSSPIYIDDGVTNNTYNNPFTTVTGSVSIYLAQATRVDLLILPPGGQSVLVPDIDVNIPETAAGSFTFPGSGPSSTQLGNNSTATQPQAVAFGDTSTASGAASTAVGQGAQATNNNATVVGQGATATGQGSTVLGQTADATAASATAVGQNAGATGAQSTALGASASATGTHSTALGFGSTATPNNVVVLGTLADDAVMAGGLQASQPAVAQTLVNGSTITFTATLSVPVTAASAVTGLILAAGAAPGQVLVIDNESVFTMAFAASGTSNVAGGGLTTIAGFSTTVFIWDNNVSLWYPANQSAPILQASTPLAGYTLINGTGTVLTWTAPNDGQMHTVIIYSQLNVTSAETGGQINYNFWYPGAGSSTGKQLIAAGNTANIYPTAPVTLLVAPGEPVTVTQNSALTVGAAVLWAQIWAI